MRILITGASGLIGKNLLRALFLEGHELVVLARSPHKIIELPEDRVFKWSHDQAVPSQALQGVDAIINLAGEGIADKKWTKKRKQQLWDSRYLATQNLIDSIQKLPCDARPRLLISASAIGYYGATGSNSTDETSARGQGFLADLCQSWESSALQAEKLGLRVILMRTGIVLSREGGALSKMGPFILGDGSQWMSWIHISDLVRFVSFALREKGIHGPYNLVSPQCSSARDLMKALGQLLGYPGLIPVPTQALKMVLGEMADMLLDSQRIFPQKLIESNFEFSFPDLESTFADLFPSRSYLDNFFSVSQFVPLQRQEVFPFFAKAENLETITPPWLNFRIVKKSSSSVENGTQIDYRLKIHGIPVRWTSVIKNWRPFHSFVDEQLRGPYTKWHHTHFFEDVPGGTLLTDQVVFRNPGWFLGKILLNPLVRSDVEQIFSHRQKVIRDLYKKGALR